jgi:hypothetical protein
MEAITTKIGFIPAAEDLTNSVGRAVALQGAHPDYKHGLWQIPRTQEARGVVSKGAKILDAPAVVIFGVTPVILAEGIGAVSPGDSISPNEDGLFVLGGSFATALAFSSDGGSRIPALISPGSRSVPEDIFSGGFFDYNDLTTQGTPIIVSADTPIILTNDGAGPFTNTAYKPIGVTDVWSAGTDTFDWSELKLGDMVDIRLDLDVTTTLNNTEVKVDLQLAIGGFQYHIPWVLSENFKTAGTHKINTYNGIYMGDTNTLDNPARFEIVSDTDCTVVVNGWYVKIIQRG